MGDHLGHVAGSAPRALVLAGDRSARTTLLDLLEGAGWRAEGSSAGAEHLRDRGLPPSRLVVADWPRLEPLWPDLLAARQRGEGAPHVVALVASGAGEHAAAAITAGADDCLEAPVRAADLAARLGVARRAAAERRGARAALAAARRDRDRLASVLEALPDGLVILAPDRTVIEVNDVFCSMTGLERGRLVGRRSLFPDWPEAERPRLVEALDECDRGGVAECDVDLPRAGAGPFPAIVGMAVARTPDGRTGAYVVTVKDVSDRVRGERARAALRRIATLATAGVAAETVLERIADELAALAGEGLVVRHGARGDAVVASSTGLEPGTAPPRRPEAIDAPIRVADEAWGAVAATPRAGEALPEGLAEVLDGLAESAATAVLADRARALREGRSGDDPVTGLPDARAFAELERREVERARRYGRDVSLVLLDVDGFRRFNEAGGTPAGNRVLAEMADHLRTHVRAHDALGRTGGDEFAWLLPETDERSAHDAADRLRRALAEQPFAAGARLTVSVGIASGASAEGAAELHRRAEVALHWAKVSGRNRAVAYSFSIAEQVVARRGEASAETPSLRAMRALAWAVDAKDPSTHRHSTRVADVAVRLAAALGWPVERSAQLREAGLVHDVGKIAVRDAVLFKPGRLTDAERAEVARHAEVGAMIVADVLSPEQAAWVRGHHERWDGGGYPDGLAGEDIPEEARLLALADSWDAMVTARSYQAPRSTEEALAEARRCSGTQFWPAAVEALERLVAAGALAAPDPAPGPPARAPGAALTQWAPA